MVASSVKPDIIPDVIRDRPSIINNNDLFGENEDHQPINNVENIDYGITWSTENEETVGNEDNQLIFNNYAWNIHWFRNITMSKKMGIVMAVITSLLVARLKVDIIYSTGTPIYQIEVI